MTFGVCRIKSSLVDGHLVGRLCLEMPLKWLYLQISLPITCRKLFQGQYTCYSNVEPPTPNAAPEGSKQIIQSGSSRGMASSLGKFLHSQGKRRKKKTLFSPLFVILSCFFSFSIFLYLYCQRVYSPVSRRAGFS